MELTRKILKYEKHLRQEMLSLQKLTSNSLQHILSTLKFVKLELVYSNPFFL